MKIQRLSWAGIKIECNKICILVDAVEYFNVAAKFMGSPREQIFKFSDSIQADFVVLTHLHPDHYDPSIINKCLKKDGMVICHKSISPKIREDGFKRQIELELNETFEFGSVSFIPVFASDGIGDPQVSWIIAHNDRKLIHCGDSIWHGKFWEIGRMYSPFDLALLPINGAVVHFEKIGYDFSPIPASMTPEQALAASKLLKTTYVIPIHYGMFDSETYQSYSCCEEVFLRIGSENGIQIRIIEPGEIVTIG
ncbi:MBL fold metallo-hydrolase [bacterium]|nr:MAG: MBL fold metallo-hydrolase [bacterium]